MSNCTSPGRGALCILIGDLTSKSALLLFTLLSASKPHFKKRPVIVNPIKCKKNKFEKRPVIVNTIKFKQRTHGGLLVILQ